MNRYVSESIEDILEEEQAFYESDTRDKLKVPPYSFVKRIPRGQTKKLINEKAAEELIRMEQIEDDDRDLSPL